MAFLVETGVGKRIATSYVHVSFADSYLSERNRSLENSWSSLSSDIKRAALIAATAYVEKRFSSSFVGRRKMSYSPITAIAKITVSSNPENGDEIIIDDITYTFVTTLSGIPFEVLIGTSYQDTTDNLIFAIGLTESGEGVVYGERTIQNESVSAERDGSIITLTALSSGSSGNFITLSADIPGFLITPFSGGYDGGEQALSFPREALYDQSGLPVEGIPLALKQAVVEYAVRAASSKLYIDPKTDSYGGAVVARSEKVGPIEESVRYAGAAVYKFSSYPEADNLLTPYLRSNTGVIHG